MPRRNFSLKTPSERTTFGIYLSPCASRNTRDGQRRRGGEAKNAGEEGTNDGVEQVERGKGWLQQLMPREPLGVIHVARDFLPRYIFISATTTPWPLLSSTVLRGATRCHSTVKKSAEAASSNTKEIQSSSSCLSLELLPLCPCRAFLLSLSPFFFAPRRVFLHADFFGFVSTGDCSI